MEEWKEVPGFPEYQVSNIGRLRSFAFSTRMGKPPEGGRILTGGKDKDGYRRAVLCADGGKTRKSMRIAPLVALLFIGPRPAGAVLRHINSVCTDDRAENLAYGTQRENMQDKKMTGHWQGGENHPMRKVNEAAVLDMRASSESGQTLADRYGISTVTVSAIRTGRLWPHVGGEVRRRRKGAP